MVEQILPVTLCDVVVRKRAKTIIGPVSTTLNETGFTVVMGSNGSGKTSLLRVVNGLERLAEGAISWSCEAQVALHEQAFVFQMPIMLRRTVMANVAYPMIVKGYSVSEANSRALDWIERIGLLAVAHQNATLLSGGEKQKLAIVRALVANPQLLILDEPTANLDGRATREIEAILQETNRAGTRVIMSTHNIGQAKRLADDVIFLHRGKIHEQAPADDFFKKPATREAAAFLRGDIVE